MPDDSAGGWIGHNKPPLKELLAEQLNQLPELLKVETAEMEKRVADLLDSETRTPTFIADGDDETAAKVIAFQGQIQKCIASAEAHRDDLTDSPLTAQRLIMGHFREHIYAKLGEPKADKKTGDRGGLFQRIGNILTDYERRKASIELARRQEEERKALEAAQAAERARQEAERLAREAVEAETRRQTEEAARIKTDADLENAIEREQQAQAEQTRRTAEIRLVQEAAERAAAEAQAAAVAADAKQSTLSKTAGLYGSSSGLRESWKARVTNHAELKADPTSMALIWDFLKPEDIEDATNRFAKLKRNTVKVAGVEFYDASRATVRA